MNDIGDLRVDKIMPMLFEYWHKITLEECLIEQGISYSKLKQKEMNIKGKFPVVDQGEKLVSGYTDEESNIYRGKLPVIIFGDHTRRVKYIDFPFAVGADGTKLLHPFEALNQKFFYYYLYSLKIESQGYSRHYKFLKQIDVPIPPLNEQRRIVAKLEKLLAKVDACKERLDKIPAILKRFRQSILSAACSGRLTADWRENNPDIESAEELLKRIYQERKKRYEDECTKAGMEGKKKPKKPKEFQLLKDHILDIPKSWAVAYPEDICSPQDYSIGIGPFGSNLKVLDYTSDGVPLIFVRHIRSGNFTGLEPKYITTEKAQELLPHMVEPLDLLITKMGEPPGDCEIYPIDRPNGIITSDCLKFRIWITDLERVFFKHCINSFIIKDQLDLITKGVAQQKISVERFKFILFPVPALAEQQEIVRRVGKLFETADKIEQRYQKAKAYLDQLTQSILAKAFRGELVPQDPNDEPASVLLERIRIDRLTQETKTTKKSSAKKPKQPHQSPPQQELPLSGSKL